MYKVTFKPGLRSPIEVEAKDEIETKKKALEHYRKNLTYMSFRSIRLLKRLKLFKKEKRKVIY